LPADLPALLGVPPDAPALAFTKGGGSEWPGYVVELLTVPSGHFELGAAGEPVWDRGAAPQDEGFYYLVWVESLPDGSTDTIHLPSRAFRARVYLAAPRIWLEHWGAVGGYEEHRVCGAIPLAAGAANKAFARAWRGLQLLHEVAGIGRPPGTGRWQSREDFLENVGDIARKLYQQYRRRPTIEMVRQYITPHDDAAEEPVDRKQITRWYRALGWASWSAFLEEALAELMSP
jgi:hypothetical protein